MDQDNQNCEVNNNGTLSKRTWAIFWISVLGLFLEMLFIRWIGTEIRIFAYLQNTILVASFLGLGLGCFTCRKPIKIYQSLIPLLILVTLLVLPVTRSTLGLTSEFLSVLDDFVIWGGPLMENPQNATAMVAVGLFITFVLVMLVVDVFVPIGRILGREMDDHPQTILAYSVNLIGSLVGTWLFVLMSFLKLPPFAWFLAFGFLMLIFIFRDQNNKRVNLALVTIIVIMSGLTLYNPSAKEVIWSPYQKLVVFQANTSDLVISVNNTGYQALKDLSVENVKAHPERFSPDLAGISQYDIPLLLHPDPQTLLIVGAGSGNDAAGGLRNGVKDITAVDIDPAIIDIGRRLHPEHPYGSSNVHLVNDDARSFFATTQKKFDVISFGLLDSHTTTSLTNARLDHYVYTKESIEHARSLLNKNGILTLTFAVQKDYIGDRLFNVLTEVFGQEPIAINIPGGAYSWGGTMFIAGDLETARAQITQNPKLSAFVEKMQEINPVSYPHTAKVATDDWPYIYLESPKIPVLYYLLAILMALVLLRSSHFWQTGNLVTRWHRSHWHFFFLGAGFLLLEVQNVSKASVVLGNTWQVNAVIVSGVLFMSLAANLLAYRFPKVPVRIAYLGLVSVGVILFFVDLAEFSFLPYFAKAIIVGGLTTLPMLFSGVIFVKSFAASESKDEALGANMIGSLVGALLQSITFVIGIKALLLLVVLLYLLSLVMMPATGKQFWTVTRLRKEQVP